MMRWLMTRRFLSNSLFAGAAGMLTAGVWVEGRGWQLAGTAIIWTVMAISITPKPQRVMKEIEDDGDE